MAVSVLQPTKPRKLWLESDAAAAILAVHIHVPRLGATHARGRTLSSCLWWKPCIWWGCGEQHRLITQSMNIHQRCGKEDWERAENRREGVGGLMYYVYAWDQTFVWVSSMCLRAYQHKASLSQSHFLPVWLICSHIDSNLHLCTYYFMCVCVCVSLTCFFSFSIWKRFQDSHPSKEFVRAHTYICMCVHAHTQTQEGLVPLRTEDTQQYWTMTCVVRLALKKRNHQVISHT